MGCAARARHPGWQAASWAIALSAAAVALSSLGGCAQTPAGPAAPAVPQSVRLTGELTPLAAVAPGAIEGDAVAVVEVIDAARPQTPLARWQQPLAGRSLPVAFDIELPAAAWRGAAVPSAPQAAAPAPAAVPAPAASAPSDAPAGPGSGAEPSAASLQLQARIDQAGRPIWLAQPVELRRPPSAAQLDLGAVVLQAQPLSLTALRCGSETLVIERLGQPGRERLWLRRPLSREAAPQLLALVPVPAASGARWQSAADARTWAWNKGERWTVALQGRTLPACRTGAATLPPLQARGHEPSWQMTLERDRLRLQLPERDRPLLASLGAPRAVLGGWRWETRHAGEPLVVSLREHACRDSMSGLPHPLAVSVQRGDRRFDGCGGAPALLLHGSWRVTALDGQPLPEQPRAASLVFDPAGKVGGRAPCNDYSGRWALGEGLRFAQVAATRRACAPEVAARELAFFQILKATHTFDLRPDGSLRLQGAGRELSAVRD